MKTVEKIHEQHIAGRRVRVLSRHVAQQLPRDARVLDVGCGDGEIAWQISQARPDLQFTGVDVLVREHTRIPIEPFDGRQLPFADQSFDVVTFIDVLHHCDWPVELLREARRVARHAIVLKDHRRDGLAAARTLRLMDWVGNHRYGVALPYNYLSWSEWQAAFAELDLTMDQSTTDLGLYPWPASMVFDRSLHFVARLLVPAAELAPLAAAEGACHAGV